MGIVLRAYDAVLNRDVAVKVVLPELAGSPEALLRFVREAQLAGRLQHPGVAPVYDLGTLPDGRAFLAMKLIEGRSLHDLLAERPDPGHDLPRFLRYFESVCQAVGYAHSRGVLHRDLKPGNIMVGAFGEAQVMDWGLAKDTASREREPAEDRQAPAADGGQREAVAPEETQAGAALGTYAYMAPEQARGEVDRIDARSDVFGLGAILCEVLTGKPPYVGKDICRQARAGDLAGAFTRLDGCGADAELIALTRACLAAERGERPRDGAAVAERVATYLAGVQERLKQAELKRAAAAASEQAAQAKAEAEKQARDRARMALTRQVAERLDGEMRELARGGHTAQAALAQGPDWQEDRLVGLLTALLHEDERIHGLTLAYEPHKGPKKSQEDHCLYVYCSSGPPKRIVTTNLLPGKGGYNPVYREWDWYKVPFAAAAGPALERRGQWTAPSFDGARTNQVWMVGYSLPMWREGGPGPVGVLCVDLELTYFTRTWGWLKELGLSENSYGFVVNRRGGIATRGKDATGAFVSHPHCGPGDGPDRPPKKITELGADDPAFVDLTRRILDGEAGRGAAVDPATGRRSTFLFTPVPSTNWSFVAVIED
jgi:hypothetical protein